MKKFLSLFALIFLFSAQWNAVDARYNLGNRKAYNEIKVGDTIAIQGISDASNNGYRYLGAATLQPTFTEDCVYEVEQGPADLRTGAATIFLRQIAQNKYLGKDGLRGQKAANSNDVQLVSTPDSAYNFALASAADSSEVWNGQHNFDASSVVFIYSYGEKGEDYQFICNWGWWEAEKIWVWGYHDTNPWDVYTVTYSKDLAGELSDLLEYYSSLGLEFTPGTDPGCYPADLAAAYEKALSDAQIAVMTEHTDAEYQEYIDNLKAAKAAVENAYIDITDGYYFVVSAYTEFLNKQRVEKGCFVDRNSNYIQWKTLDVSDPAFVFKFTKLNSGNVQVQSFAEGNYWNAPASDSNSQGIALSSTPNKEQIFTNIGGGQWQITNTFSAKHYHPESNGAGSGSNGKLVTWNSSGLGSSSTWYLRSVPQEKIDSLTAVKIQNQLTAELGSEYNEAASLYEGLFVYKTDTDNPLITHVTDGDPDDCQLSSNASDPSEGLNLSNLIDGAPETFWHSSYHATADPQTYHYLQADISNNPQKYFQIYFMRRSGTYGNYDRPTKVNIYAAADTTGQWEGKADWKLVKTLTGLPTSSSINDYTSPGIELDFEASYIRFEVIEKSNYPSRALNGYPYFNLAEFQIYPTVLDKENSQYYYAAGMQAAADALVEQMAAAKEKIDSNTATQEDIDALKAAIEAVSTLYADTTALVNNITAAKRYLNGVQVGTAMGNAKSQEAIDALQAAVAKAEAAKPTTGKLDKEALDAAVADLKASIKEFLQSLNMPDGDHWYYITSLDASRDDNEDLYTKGGYMYVKGYGVDQGVVWALDTEATFGYNPFAMWHFIPVEDEDYNLTYYIQNLATGLYVGDYPTYSQPIVTTAEPVLYRFNLSGGQLGLIATKGQNPGYSLHAANSSNAVVGWSAGANTASAWDIVAVDPTEIDAITIPAHNNNIDVFAVPYDYAELGEINEDVHTYAIKSMTLDKETDITTIELYEKSEFKAGEPCILVTGDPTEEESEETTLVIPTPTEIAQAMTPANGLVGLLATEAAPLNTAWFTGKEITIKNEPVHISAHTGYIDATLYKGAVEGVETALTLEIKGLNWPSGDAGKSDVNKDGEINTADVVAVYNFIIDGEASGISEADADVDGDGEVSTADVVAIYNDIIGGGEE